MNKKSVLTAISCFLILFIFSSCGFYNNTNPSETTEKNEGTIEEFKTTAVLNEITPETDAGGADLLPRKYRNNYYSIPASFIKIVGKPSFEEWEDDYLAKNYPDNSNEMVMVAYVKAFNISKKDFESANLNYAKFIDEHYSHICLNPQDYADQEMQEIYNTDIIYTFDNKIINDYYLGIDYPFLNEYQYEEAVANGTYETRTTEFVDIKQMEAEIIAKYGEAEIVTEAAETTEE